MKSLILDKRILQIMILLDAIKKITQSIVFFNTCNFRIFIE